jgi:hypothetical protein
MLSIGIDLDNTIADYDEIFFDIAREMEYIEADGSLGKSDVKDLILHSSDGDLRWQKLQGQVYGRWMHRAKLFPGFLAFLWASIARGNNVYIISHKSMYGHFDVDRIPLRDRAFSWINNWLVDANLPDYFRLNENIFFEETRKQKVERIDSVGCDLFIDDLNEVFLEPGFPAQTQKILFNKVVPQTHIFEGARFNSWPEITKHIYGELSPEDILYILKRRFPSLDIRNISLKLGGGNSKVYQISDGKNTRYALKIYPDLSIDRRPRLKTESSAVKLLWNNDLPVPKLICSDLNLNWGIYQWLEGEANQVPDLEFIYQSVFFIKELNKRIKNNLDSHLFSNASEACLSGEDLSVQIDKRLQSLKEVGSKELDEFLDKCFLPKYAYFISRAKSLLGDGFARKLEKQFQILSPSDFGSHNAVKCENQQYYFYDFEYFGFDDPVKLVSDYLWHPGMILDNQKKIKWLELTEELFAVDPYYLDRLSAYSPLFGLRWCLIMLNEFLPNRFSLREHSGRMKDADIVLVLHNQMNKAKNILKEISQMVKNG